MRGRPSVERFLIAWLTGALVGAGALLLEWGIFGRIPGLRAFAAYALVGGALAGFGRSAFAVVLPAHPARLATVFGLASFAALEILYVVNVRLLPSEHYLSWKSLTADAVALAVVASPLLAVAHSRRVHRARLRLASTLAMLGAAAIVVSTALTLWVPAAAPPAHRADVSPANLDVFVVVLDSVRRDRSEASAGDTLMPALRALERESRVFTKGFASSSWTVPSVADMLRSGPRHQGHPTLAEEMSVAGWQTACFTDNPHLWRGSDLLRGFGLVRRSVGEWRDTLRGTVLGEVVERLRPGDDERLVDRIETWLQGAKRPVFAYVHLMDAHAPYRFERLDGQHPRVRRIEYPMIGMSVTDAEAADVRARYDAGVRRSDEQLGRLVAALRARGRPYLAIVTADHGESLGEFGRWFHGKSLAPELIDVPLLVLGSGTQIGHVEPPATNRDVRHTVLAAAGLPCADCEGSDLRTGEGGPVHGGLPPHLTYRVAGRFKLVLDHRSGAQQLFDIAADPQERFDVRPKHPEVAAALADGLAAGAAPSAPSPDALEGLRALGYSGY